jgi:hypothetical protein
MKTLRSVAAIFCPTSALAGLSTVPGIRTVIILTPTWNLDADGRAAVARLKDVTIVFSDVEERNEKEIAFWKKLHFVEFYKPE